MRSENEELKGEERKMRLVDDEVPKRLGSMKPFEFEESKEEEDQLRNFMDRLPERFRSRPPTASKEEIEEIRRKIYRSNKGAEEYLRQVRAEFGPEEAERRRREMLDKYHAEHPLPKAPDPDPELLENMRKYNEMLNRSGGYDVDVALFEQISLDDTCVAPLVPMFYDMANAKDDDLLILCSNLALDVYNSNNAHAQEGTTYVLHEVLQANYTASRTAGATYFITFLAKDSDSDDSSVKLFQARVLDHPKHKPPQQVLQVRLKPPGPFGSTSSSGSAPIKDKGRDESDDN